MNSKIVFVVLLVLAGAIIFGVSAKKKRETSTIASSSTIANVQASPIMPQAKTVGAVEVEIKPISIEQEKDVSIAVSMNTHSVELDYDFLTIATLTDGRGNAYKPTRWTGNTGGHHLNGELIFDPLTDMPKELTLTLDGVDSNVETFIWQF